MIKNQSPSSGWTLCASNRPDPASNDVFTFCFSTTHGTARYHEHRLFVKHWKLQKNLISILFLWVLLSFETRYHSIFELEHVLYTRSSSLIVLYASSFNVLYTCSQCVYGHKSLYKWISHLNINFFFDGSVEMAAWFLKTWKPSCSDDEQKTYFLLTQVNFWELLTCVASRCLGRSSHTPGPGWR